MWPEWLSAIFDNVTFFRMTIIDLGRTKKQRIEFSLFVVFSKIVKTFGISSVEHVEIIDKWNEIANEPLG